MANILGRHTLNGIEVLEYDVNPVGGTGTSAPLGSFGSAADGSGFFIKTSAGNTGWNSAGANGNTGSTGLTGGTGIGTQGNTGNTGQSGNTGSTGPSAITNGEISSSTNITTTNAGTRAVLTGFTTTPASGDWLFIFSGTCTHSAVSGTVNIALNVGGTEKVDSIRSTQNPSTGTATRSRTIAVNGKVTVNGAQAVGLFWNITTAGTGTMVDCTMNWIKVG
jgi:hypothetical protein